MAKEFLFVVIIIAVAILLLSIRLVLGRKTFVNIHVDGNPEMQKRGIHCVKRQDYEARTNSGLKISEHATANPQTPK